MSDPPNPFLDRMAAGAPAVGSFVFSSDPAVTEILGASGFDLAIIDTEHAPLGIGDLIAHGRAAGAAQISWWVRVGRFDPPEIGRILDLGAQGIIFPHFGRDPAESRAMAESLRYPPEGSRPTCTGIRSASYGCGSFADYVVRANRRTWGIGLIEDADVVDRVDEVLSDCRLEAVMPGGVGDLASSMGLHGQARHPRVMAAVRRVVEAAKAKGPPLKVGVYVSDHQSLEELAPLEPDFFVFSIDYKVIAGAYQQIAAAFRDGSGRSGR